MVRLNGDYMENGADIDDSDRHYAASGLEPGKAYGFFEREGIGAELSRFRDSARTPPEVDISLIEDMDSSRMDPALKPIIDDARSRDIRYATEVKFPDATNGEGASEMALIFNQAYQSNAFDKGDHFRGAVVYKQDGEYIFRE
jgi:hypothetical protein